MEFKLNVYKGNEVEKTYTVQDFRVSTGLSEDIMAVVDFEELFKMENLNESNMDELLKGMSYMIGLRKHYKSFVSQLFPEMTEDEYRRTDAKEVSTVCFNLVMYVFTQIMSVAEKN